MTYIRKVSLYQMLRMAGCELANHESDLYVKVSGKADCIIRGYNAHASMFRDDIDGEWWYDIPFAYEPFWDKVLVVWKGEGDEPTKC